MLLHELLICGILMCWPVFFVCHVLIYCICLLLVHWNVLNATLRSVWKKPPALSRVCSNTHVHPHTRKVSSPPERLILAADMVMKQLNHGPAPRRNCACVCVRFLFLQWLSCLHRLLAYSYTTRTSTPLIDMAIPCHAYFSLQEGPQANYA